MKPWELIDCCSCNAQINPDERYCWNCKEDNWTEERVQMEFDMQHFEEKQYVQYLLEENLER